MAETFRVVGFCAGEMYLYVIRVSVDPPLYVVGVSASPEDAVESLRQRLAPLVPELAGQGLIDSRRLLTIEATVHHVLTALRLAKPTRGWFIDDANLADLLNTDRLDAWFTSTTEITKAAKGYTLPAPRQAEILNDLGGRENCSAIKRSYVAQAARLEVMAGSIGSQLVALGITTPKGRVRSLYTAYLQAVAAWERLVRQLGLDRQLKPVDSLDSWLQRQGDVESDQ